LRGLGNQQLKLRNQTDSKIKKLLERRGSLLSINDVIKGTRKDPTSILNSINRLIKDETILEYRYKNKRLVCWPSVQNRIYISTIKKEEEKVKRSKAQIDNLVYKRSGELVLETKKLKEKLKVYEPDTDVLFKKAVKSYDEGTIVKAWGEIDKEKSRLMLERDSDDEKSNDKRWQRIEVLDKRDKILSDRMFRDDIVPMSSVDDD